MDKIIKLNSRQGGPFNQQQNLCDFDLPGDGTYNLADSYINLYARVTGTTGASTITNMGTNDQRVATLANLAVNWKDSPARSFYNIAMVKNCALSSEQAGVLEDIRRVDILKQNLMWALQRILPTLRRSAAASPRLAPSTASASSGTST